jgi:hypothetical protein
MINSRRLRCASHVARMEECRSPFRILTGKPTPNRLLWMPRHRWKDNIRINLKIIGLSTRNWVESAQDRDYWNVLVNVALNPRVPLAIELVSCIITSMRINRSPDCMNSPSPNSSETTIAPSLEGFHAHQEAVRPLESLNLMILMMKVKVKRDTKRY